jgi:hypothetical protein
MSDRRKYDTPQHRAERKKWARIVAAGNAWCAETVCLMASRWIEPGTPWDVAHDVTGTWYLGAAHSRCNRSEAASRGNRQRRRRASWILPDRWPR